MPDSAVLEREPKAATADTAKTAPAYRQPPANIEGEQALLGALLVNNDEISRIGDLLRSEHFYEPVHQRIFEAIIKFNDRGLIASPVTLKHYFEQDDALADIGGGQYLARLAAAAMHVIDIRDFADMIHDLAIKRQLITIGEDIVNSAYAQDMDSGADSQVEDAEQKLFNLSVEGSGDRGFRQIRHAVMESIQRAEIAIKNEGSISGVDTGLQDLNKMLGGMQNSDLIILAGRPSMGKTALATNIAYNACKTFANLAKEAGLGPKETKSVGFFSLEMSAEQLATRMLSSACEFPSQKITRGQLAPDDFNTLVRISNEMSQLPFHIDDTPALSIAALRTRARRLKRTNNLGLVIVDYLQLVRPSATKASDNRVQEVSEITQGLKAIAKELNVPVVALSQLSRQVENRGSKPRDKIPQLADLRESGSIEQDADVVLFIYREEYYVLRDQPREGTPEHDTWQTEMNRVMNIAEVIVAKHRNGPVGTVPLHFDSNLTYFSNLASGRQIAEMLE